MGGFLSLRAHQDLLRAHQDLLRAHHDLLRAHQDLLRSFSGIPLVSTSDSEMLKLAGEWSVVLSVVVTSRT